MKLTMLVCCHKEDIMATAEPYMPLQVGKDISKIDLNIQQGGWMRCTSPLAIFNRGNTVYFFAKIITVLFPTSTENFSPETVAFHVAPLSN